MFGGSIAFLKWAVLFPGILAVGVRATGLRPAALKEPIGTVHVTGPSARLSNRTQDTPSEIKIGYFGPDDPEDDFSGDLWLAASIAVEEVNHEGGYQGRPFRLVQGWSADPWGTGISQVTRMVFAEQVWALIAPVDGPSAHLAEQVVAKARLPLLNPGSSDRTANLANVPWFFSCLPGENLQVPVLFRALEEKSGDGSFVLISGTDHDSRILTAAFERFISLKGRSPVLHIEYDLKEERSLQTLDSLPETIASFVVLAGAEASATIVKTIRRHFEVPVIGGPAMGRRQFLELAGAASEDILFPLLGLTGSGDSFDQKFRTKSGCIPDFAARQTYDSVRLLALAIERAGLDRERIRDVLRELVPWQGITGVVDWDQFGQNQRSVRLATIEDGRVRPLVAQ